MTLGMLRSATIIGLAVLAASTALAAKKGGPWKLGDIIVEQAWDRLAPGGAGTGSVYLTVHNKSGQDDLLLAVDISLAESTAIYSTTVKDGVASMDPLPMGVNLPSQERSGDAAGQSSHHDDGRVEGHEGRRSVACHHGVPRCWFP